MYKTPNNLSSEKVNKGQRIKLQRGVVTGQHQPLEKVARHKYIDGARPLERGTFKKCTPPRNKEMTQVPQKTHNPKGGTKTQPATSFSLRRELAHERTRNSLNKKGTR